MEVSIKFQTLLFFYFIIYGIILAIFYDLLYCIRKEFKLNVIKTAVCDFLFFLGFFSSFFIIIINLSKSVIRNYIIMGVILGIIFYYLTFSDMIKKIFFLILSMLKKIFLRIFCKLKKIINKFTKKAFNFKENDVK